MYELLLTPAARTPLGDAISQVSASIAGEGLTASELQQWFFCWAREGIFAGTLAR